ncbi:MAG: WD40 repeat domain-containing protein [Armatimonadetes bacterium]|nr:WD40 repeat domain-containing protein [Armatimonadota bacterium]
MKSAATPNRVVAIIVITFIVFGAWWISRPAPSPFTLQARWDLQGSVHGVAFSPKGDLLSVLVHIAPPVDRLVMTFWQVPEGKPVYQNIVVGHKPKVFYWRPISFSPDGQFCAVGYHEQGLSKVVVFSVANGHRVRTIAMGKGDLASVTFAPDGKNLAFIYDDRVWFVDVASGQKTKTNIVSWFFVFSPDAQFIASNVPASETVDIYDAGGRHIRQLRVNRPSSIFSLYAATFSKDGQRLLCVWREGWMPSGRVEKFRKWIFIWRTKDWMLEQSLPLTPYYHPYVVPATGSPVDISSEGAIVALAEPRLSDLKWALWQGEQFISRFIKFLKIPEPPILPNQVSIRQIANGQLITKLQRFGIYVTHCAFSPDGHHLAVVYEDKHGNGKVAIWRIR